MNRRIRALGLAIVFLFIISCSIPISIPVDFDGSDSADQEDSAPSEILDEPDPTPTEGPLDCGLDLDCFYKAVIGCQESSVEYSQSLDMMGTEIFSALLFDIKGPVEDQCQFNVKTSKVLVSYSEDAVQQLLDSGLSEEEIETQRLSMEQAQAEAGFDESCQGIPEDLITMLQAWEAGKFSMDDWDPFSCEGKIFSAQVTEPEPTEEIVLTVEVASPTDDNFLANMSFEANPETTQPSWIVDTKNTNVVAKWTNEQSKLGQYSLKLSTTNSANQGFPGWFMVEAIPIEEVTWHVFEVWAMTPDGADAFVSAEYLDENSVKFNTQSSGCVDLEPNIWTRVGFGITEDRIAELSFLRLGLQQCTLETEGTITTLYYDQIYLGTTPP